MLYSYVNKNTYIDSVSLMVLSSSVSAVDGIKNAAVMMGTEHNKDIMKQAGLFDGSEEAGTSDLIIGIEAESEDAKNEALNVIDDLLNNSKKEDSEDTVQAKTLDSAYQQDPSSNIAVISVPGRYAKTEAMKALNKGMHVLLFSDNVSLEAENELKEIAVEKGLLMMGPDCGTAIVNGVALGFANVVRRGNIGIVAAAGTGLQETSVIIDKQGGGLSQGLGTGGRDIKSAIGGKMMLQEIEALNEDEATDIIVLISKPPAEDVLKKIIEATKEIKKPMVACLLGAEKEILEGTNIHYAKTLEDAAVAAVDLAEGKSLETVRFTGEKEKLDSILEKETNKLNSTQKYVRGLFSGGTLCYEGMIVAQDEIGDIYSNVPLKSSWELDDLEVSKENTFIDMGEDYFTDGLPHPMIDTRLRSERILREAKDPQVAVLLMDVVIGYGSHEDPAGSLLPAIQEAKEMAAQEGRYLSVVASVCGTAQDPQGLKQQEQKLTEAGVIVMPSNAQAARMASSIALKEKNIQK